MGGCMRMLVLLIVLAGCSWKTNRLENMVEVCADPDAPTRDVVHFCTEALKNPELGPVASAQVRTNLGAALSDLERYDEAVTELDAAIEEAPQLVAAYLNRARAYERLGQLGAAMADYGAAIGIDPEGPEGYLGRGALLLGNGAAARAIADLDRAVELRPEWTSPRFNRGLAYLETGALAKAEADFDAVIDASGRDAGAYLNRGRARAGLGKTVARDDFDRALELNPEWAAAWYARGRYLDRLGARDEANRDLLRAYDLGYADPWLVKRVREISR